MNCKEIIINIIIPVICALISGILTIIGVGLTIKHENKKSKHVLKLSNKPIFYRIDPNQEYNYKIAHDYQFNFYSNKKLKDICGIFKNTDNAILFLNYISVDGNKYFPSFGNVIDKNEIFNIYVCSEIDVSSKSEVIMSIYDILNNEYKYKLFCETTSSDLVNILKFEEIK